MVQCSRCKTVMLRDPFSSFHNCSTGERRIVLCRQSPIQGDRPESGRLRLPSNPRSGYASSDSGDTEVIPDSDLDIPAVDSEDESELASFGEDLGLDHHQNEAIGGSNSELLVVGQAAPEEDLDGAELPDPASDGDSELPTVSELLESFRRQREV